MTDYYNSVIRELAGIVDGVNRTFTTPSKYVTGTIKVVWNGQVYEDTDDRTGWTEIDDETIELTEAPLVDDVLQAFYQDKDSQHLGLDSVVGSPFDPNGILP